jgi:hypothetical protein
MTSSTSLAVAQCQATIFWANTSDERDGGEPGPGPAVSVSGKDGPSSPAS